MAAKKARKKKKKSKPQSGASQPGRLDSNLQGYWKRGHYGEFVTLFVRHWEQARKTDSSQYWDKAVSNALLKALFEKQDFSLLHELLNTLEKAPQLCEANRSRLQLCRAVVALVNGQASSSLIQGLPRDLPQPFSALRDHLAARAADTESSPLSDYLKGKRKRARKGEKTFSLAVKASNALNELDPEAETSRPLNLFTQIRRMFQDLNASFTDSRGFASPVLNDAQGLAELMREMRANPQRFFQATGVNSFLRSKGFGFSSHPYILQFLERVLAQGRHWQGPAWEQTARMSLAVQCPALMPPMPDRTRKQIQAINSLKRPRAAPGSHQPMDQWLNTLLKNDVWTSRERFFLLVCLLHVLRHRCQRLVNMVNSRFEPDREEMLKALMDLPRRLTETLLRLVSLHQDLIPEDTDSLERALDIWEQGVEPLPLDFAPEALSALTATLTQLHLPASRYLFILAKSSDTVFGSKNTSAIKAIARTAPLKLTAGDLSRASDILGGVQRPHAVFKCWRPCLSTEDQTALAEKVLTHAFEQAVSLDALEPPFAPVQECPWCALPIDLVEQLHRLVSPDFALRGLTELTLALHPTSPPMPSGPQEAELLLTQIPPHEKLFPLLIWMLTWPKNRYSAALFEQLIRQAAESITQHRQWSELALAVRDDQFKDLAARIWALWKEQGLFERLEQDQDFAKARSILMVMAQPRAPQGKKGRSKGKSLLEEVLEERRRNKNRDK